MILFSFWIRFLASGDLSWEEAEELEELPEDEESLPDDQEPPFEEEPEEDTEVFLTAFFRLGDTPLFASEVFYLTRVIGCCFLTGELTFIGETLGGLDRLFEGDWRT